MSAEITPQELAALFEDDDDTVEAGACDAFDTADDNILADNEHAHDAVDDDYGDILADEDDSNGANQQKGPAVGDLHLDLDGEPSDANGDDLGHGTLTRGNATAKVNGLFGDKVATYVQPDRITEVERNGWKLKLKFVPLPTRKVLRWWLNRPGVGDDRRFDRYFAISARQGLVEIDRAKFKRLEKLIK